MKGGLEEERSQRRREHVLDIYFERKYLQVNSTTSSEMENKIFLWFGVAGNDSHCSLVIVVFCVNWMSNKNTHTIIRFGYDVTFRVQISYMTCHILDSYHSHISWPNIMHDMSHIGFISISHSPTNHFPHSPQTTSLSKDP